MIDKLVSATRALLVFFGRQPGIVRILVAVCMAAFAAIAFLAILFLLIWMEVLGPLPSTEELSMAENPAASEVYSADSVLLGRFFLQERSNIAYAELPQHVIDALVATEDARFYEHGGIDTKSVLRVFTKGLLMQSDAAGGGSTITQQLAKNLYNRKRYLAFSLLINKIREMIIAVRLEQVYNKDALLGLYLNTVPFGENIYGIEAASALFFSIPAAKLTPEQGATLVGMLKANHIYNPRLYPERSLSRRNVVLAQMEKYGKLPAEQTAFLQSLPLELRYNKVTHHSGLAPYFREYLRPYLLAWCVKYNDDHGTELNLYTSGLKIYTTIDSRLQRYAEEGMKRQMTSIQDFYLRQWNKAQPWDRYPGMIDDLIRRSQRYKQLERQGLDNQEILRTMKTPVPMTVFSWTGEKEVPMSPIDSIKYYLKFLNAGVLAMDPLDGAIRVWVGGIDHRYFQFDHVRESTKRQVGSTFKPIVYASAIEHGEHPCTFISAQKTVYTNMEDWSPENSDENYGLLYSMPGALAQSVNTVSVQLLEKAGIDNTIQLARKMGIQSRLEPVPSLALGSADISLLEMVKAYSAFVSGGQVASPYYITAITDHDKRQLERFKAPPLQAAMSEESSLLVLHMLRRAVNEGGTSAGIRSRFGLPNDLGGKTGTTQANTDGWFLALTPHLVIGAWVGADDPRMRPKAGTFGQGARTALPIVADFLQRANQDKSLGAITRARFPELPPALARKIDCSFYKEDKGIFRKLFTNPEKGKKRDFGSQRPGFFKRLFGKKKKTG